MSIPIPVLSNVRVTRNATTTQRREAAQSNPNLLSQTWNPCCLPIKTGVLILAIIDILIHLIFFIVEIVSVVGWLRRVLTSDGSPIGALIHDPNDGDRYQEPYGVTYLMVDSSVSNSDSSVRLIIIAFYIVAVGSAVFLLICAKKRTKEGLGTWLFIGVAILIVEMILALREMWALNFSHIETTVINEEVSSSDNTSHSPVNLTMILLRALFKVYQILVTKAFIDEIEMDSDAQRHVRLRQATGPRSPFTQMHFATPCPVIAV